MTQKQLEILNHVRQGLYTGYAVHCELLEGDRLKVMSGPVENVEEQTMILRINEDGLIMDDNTGERAALRKDEAEDLGQDIYLHDAELDGSYANADFSRITFQNARIRGSFLGCNFQDATIRGEVSGAVFKGCDFQRATLHKTAVEDAVFEGNNFMRARFLRSSLYRTELNGNDFMLTEMNDMHMRDTTVRKANRNTDHIQYAMPGGTRQEAERMKESCMGQMQEKQPMAESPYDAAIEEALAAAELEAVNMGMEM